MGRPFASRVARWIRGDADCTVSELRCAFPGGRTVSIPRVAWKDLPREVRSAVEKRTGRVLDASDVPTGANSGIAVRLLTETDALFVKGVPVDHPQVSTQVREALINPHLPASAPRLRWHAETAGWDLLAFEMIDGRTADFSPGSRDLPLVVGALLELALAHCPAQPLRTMPEGRLISSTGHGRREGPRGSTRPCGSFDSLMPATHRTRPRTGQRVFRHGVTLRRQPSRHSRGPASRCGRASRFIARTRHGRRAWPPLRGAGLGTGSHGATGPVIAVVTYVDRHD